MKLLETKNKMRIEALTFLRFIAAAIVVVFHYGQATDLARWANPFISAGPQMVSFFFTLSGFVLMVAYGGRRLDSLSKYYQSRFARIAPVYFISLAAMGLMMEWKGGDTPLAFWLNAAFLQSWFPPHTRAFNPPAWSLSVEAFFYLTFPLIVWTLRESKTGTAKCCAIALAFFVFSQAILINLLNSGFYAGFPSVSHDLIYYFPLSHYCSFLLGVAGGYIFQNNPDAFGRPGLARTTSMLAMLVIVYLLIDHEADLVRWFGFQVPFGASFHSLAFIGLILSVAAGENIVTRSMSMRPLAILGEASYGLYILQDPVRVVYDRLIAPRYGFSANGTFYVYFGMLLVAALVSLYWIERPLKALILNRRNSDPKLPLPFSASAKPGAFKRPPAGWLD